MLEIKMKSLSAALPEPANNNLANIIIISLDDIKQTCTCKQFVCVEVLRPRQPNGVMSSAVSLPNHMFTGQACPLSG